MHSVLQKRILLLDGEDRIRILFKEFLEKENFTVEEATSGMQVLWKLEKTINMMY